MRKVSVDFLQLGMKVARPIYNSNGQVLLNKGVILDCSYIDRLKKLNIPALYIDDGLLPELEVNDVIIDETRIKAIGNIKNMFKKGTGNNLAKSIVVSADVLKSVNDILEELLSKTTTMVNLADIRVSDDYTFAHSVNVCVLSLVTGMALGYNRKKLYNLALGAILHDIGKIRVPNEY